MLMRVQLRSRRQFVRREYLHGLFFVHATILIFLS